MRIGIDLGGTKTEIIGIDDGGRQIYRKRIPTPQGDYEKTLSSMAWLVFDLERETGLKSAGVGIGTPGALSPTTGLIKNSNSTCLIGKPLDKDLEKLLGRPVRLANDANCFALSEATDGVAKDEEVVFGVILGTGVGGAIVVHKNILSGANAIAGEWGHNPLPWPSESELPGPACYCGKNGCIESFLSGPSLARDHEKVTGEKLNGEEVISKMRQGHPPAVKTFDRYTDRLARSLATVINILDPGIVVLGGGLSNIEELYQIIPILWSRYIFSDHVRTKLKRGDHGDSGGVRGAAWLFKT